MTLKILELTYISVAQWNSKRDTESLLIDRSIINQIRSINLAIRELNKGKGQNTIHFSAECTRCRKSKNKRPRYSPTTNCLTDGVHPNKITSLIWTKKLLLDSYKCCYQEPDILDISVLSGDINDLNNDTE